MKFTFTPCVLLALTVSGVVSALPAGRHRSIAAAMAAASHQTSSILKARVPEGEIWPDHAHEMISPPGSKWRTPKDISI
ncbi:hypothetical protein B0H21DRAFT_127597 [Amylocystis lapponica]|nr:hypothetical protein B0H21DRAFT_127597 [Amylocystis lapponica]